MTDKVRYEELLPHEFEERLAQRPVGYLPIGILVYTFPNPLFDLLRYLLMLAGLAILGWNYYRKSHAE